MKVVFWNLGGASASDECLQALVSSEKPTLVALAEFSALNLDDPPAGYTKKRLSTRLAILSTDRVKVLAHTDKRLSKFSQIIQLEEWSIAVCHLKSLLNDGEAERDSLLRRLKRHLWDRVPWKCLAVIGDLNINPWERGILDKESLHGLQTRAEASVGLDYDGEHFPALLNESYQLARPFPAGNGEVWGTYRHKESKLHSSLRWHIFDQALVSPDVQANVSVVTELPSLPWYQGLGEKTKRPEYPDHLPIVVELKGI